MTYSPKTLEVIRAGREAIKPTTSGDPVEWLERNVAEIPDSHLKGPFRNERMPWVGDAVRYIVHPEVRQVLLPWCIQAGKSAALRLSTAYFIVNDPGNMLLLQMNQDEADDFFLRQCRPLFDAIPEVVKRKKQDDMPRSSVGDFQRMIIYCRSAHTKTSLQRITTKYVFGDECWRWPKGHMEEAMGRTTQFSWNSKHVFASQGGTPTDDFHQLLEQPSTNIHDWSFNCPKCNTLQPYDWSFVRFPEDAKDGDDWDTAKVKAGTTYECRSCNTRHTDSRETRFELNLGGKFHPREPGKSIERVGLHLNALAMMSFGELGRMMLEAKRASVIYGDEEPRRIFKQKRLALAYSEDGGSMVTPVNASDYALADDWAEEAVITPKAQIATRENAPAGSIPFRTLGIDVQRGHFWAVVRRWSRTGQSRLMAFEKIETWSGLDDLAKKHGVHKALVAVDSGDNTQTVYAECCRRGWKAFKGSGSEDFAVTSSNGQTTRRFYSDPQAIIVPGQPTRVSLIVHSASAGKDLLHGLRVRKLHTYPRDAVEDYAKQLNSEVRIKDKRTGKPMWILPQGVSDNHALDCEILAMLIAVRWGVVGREATTTETEAPNA
jgi:phage terminase large subunit GpA-like protein